MSQEGIIDIIGTHPEIPTEFVANVGFAIPIANTLELLGEVVAAGTNPFRSVASGDTVTYQVQIAQAIASTNATNIGLAAFSSADFGVDANGFVTINALAGATKIGVDAFTPPGTNPVVPSGTGVITVTGAQVAAGTTTNVIRTNSLAVNSLTIEIQRSSAQAVSTVGANGVSHFDSARFTVGSDGFVSVSGTGIGQTITGQSGGALSPTAGNWNIFGASTAAGTSPVTTSGAASTLTVNVQKTQAIAGTDATKVGLAAFDSTSFAVDANGFVTLAGGGLAIDSIHPDSGTDPVVPTAAGLVNIVGSGSTTTVGSLNTLTVQLTGLTNHNLLIGAGTTTITKVAPSATSGIPVISQGAAADPTFGTAVVAGGGTGATSFTANGAVISNTTTTGALAAVALASQQFLVGTSGAPIAKSLSIVVQTFTANGTYTPTSGMLYCNVEVIGGGGGGGGCAAPGAGTSAAGGGGGGGEYAKGVVSAATIGASQAVTIGTAGTAGANTGGAGGTGGTTSLGALITAIGGTGGAGGVGSASYIISGGIGGTGGSGGDFRTAGSPGGAGFQTIGTAGFQITYPGMGGSTFFGGGGISNPNVNTGQNAGSNGTSIGGGGSGAAAGLTGTAVAGGAGFKGGIIITEYVIA